MADFIGFKFTGGPELARALSQLAVAVRTEVLREALHAAAAPIATRMAQLATRGPDAPHLADSIAIQTQRQVDGVNLQPGEAAVAVGPAKDFFYGYFLEFGWKFHPSPRPFARPAFDSEANGALQIMADRVWAAIRGERAMSTTAGGL